MIETEQGPSWTFPLGFFLNSPLGREGIVGQEGLFLKKRLYLFIFRERGREREREGNINVWLPVTHPLLRTWPAAQACALTGNRTSDPLLCSLVLSPDQFGATNWSLWDP